MSLDRKHEGIGVGGYRCVCCGPSPRDRDKYRRQMKRRNRQRIRQEIEEMIANAKEE